MSAAFQPSAADLADFVYREAHLLDTRQFEAWYGLFAEDGRYWLPMTPDQSDWGGRQSIVIEDRLMLRIRVERLKNPKVYSQQPAVRCQHVLQAPVVEAADHDANAYRTRTPFFYAEFRHDEQLTLTGVATHSLRVESGALVIVEKRVDLLNAAGALPGIFLMP